MVFSTAHKDAWSAEPDSSRRYCNADITPLLCGLGQAISDDHLGETNRYQIDSTTPEESASRLHAWRIPFSHGLSQALDVGISSKPRHFYDIPPIPKVNKHFQPIISSHLHLHPLAHVRAHQLPKHGACIRSRDHRDRPFLPLAVPVQRNRHSANPRSHARPQRHAVDFIHRLLQAREAQPCRHV